MTRKDYIAFAIIFASRKPEEPHDKNDALLEAKRAHYVSAVADIFERDNSRFDRARFYDACRVSL